MHVEALNATSHTLRGVFEERRFYILGKTIRLEWF